MKLVSVLVAAATLGLNVFLAVKLIANVREAFPDEAPVSATPRTETAEASTPAGSVAETFDDQPAIAGDRVVATVTVDEPAAESLLAPPTTPAGIILRMMQQGFPGQVVSDSLVTLVNAEPDVERASIAMRLSASDGLTRWKRNLEFDSELSEAHTRARIDAYRRIYVDLTRDMTAREKEIFDGTQVGQRFGFYLNAPL